MVAFEPHSPHTLVIATCVYIPNFQAFRDVFPCHPICTVLHSDVENVGLSRCVWNKVFLVFTWVFRVIQDSRATEKIKKLTPRQGFCFINPTVQTAKAD